MSSIWFKVFFSVDSQQTRVEKYSRKILYEFQPVNWLDLFSYSTLHVLDVGSAEWSFSVFSVCQCVMQFDKINNLGKEGCPSPAHAKAYTYQ